MKWIYQYKCGCSDGPKRKDEMLEYCGIHGADLQVKYPDIRESGPRERPIIFSAEMVRAILDGRKTQTRRVIKPQPNIHSVMHPAGQAELLRDFLRDHPCPYGKPGDRLWIKETWAEMCKNADPVCWCEEEERKANHYFEYKADNPRAPYPGDWPEEEAKGNPEAPKWKSSRFMPRRASRLILEITNVTVARVQEINYFQIMLEGAPLSIYPHHLADTSDGLFSWWITLWETINAKRGFGWDVNPWVWVIEFKRIEKGTA